MDEQKAPEATKAPEAPKAQAEKKPVVTRKYSSAQTGAEVTIVHDPNVGTYTETEGKTITVHKNPPRIQGRLVEVK